MENLKKTNGYYTIQMKNYTKKWEIWSYKRNYSKQMDKIKYCNVWHTISFENGV